MKQFIVLAALACLSTVSLPVGAMPRQHCNCDCLSTKISPSVLDELSRPEGNAMDAETGDADWDQAQAMAERDREYSTVEHRDKGHVDQRYKVAAPLIDAQYAVSSAEIDQVVKGQVKPAVKDLDAARGDIDKALKVARPQQRPPLTALWDDLQRADLSATLCHGQSLGEDRYQYERVKASLRREIRTL